MRNRNLQRVAWLGLLVATMPVAGAYAQYVRVAPPPAVVERPPAAPRPGYVWVPGYQRWDGRRYVWTGGRWVAPPRRTAVWVPGHWVQRPQGWFWIQGGWRG